MTPIDPFPTPPSPSRPEQFDAEGDAFLGHFPTFRAQANALADEVNTVAAQAMAASATAVAQASAALGAVGAQKWVSGSIYAVGDTAWSPVNGLSYRRKVAGSGTLDPSVDAANWTDLNAGAGLIYAALIF